MFEEESKSQPKLDKQKTRATLSYPSAVDFVSEFFSLLLRPVRAFLTLM